MNRRDSFKVSLGALAAGAVAPAMAKTAAVGEAPKDREPFVQYGRPLATSDDANPLGVAKVAFNMVSPDLAASKRLYKECLEYDVVDEGVTSKGQSDAPGIGAPGRK